MFFPAVTRHLVLCPATGVSLQLKANPLLRFIIMVPIVMSRPIYMTLSGATGMMTGPYAVSGILMVGMKSSVNGKMISAGSM